MQGYRTNNDRWMRIARRDRRLSLKFEPPPSFSRNVFSSLCIPSSCNREPGSVSGRLSERKAWGK
jgi:hypothetical protein